MSPSDRSTTIHHSHDADAGADDRSFLPLHDARSQTKVNRRRSKLSYVMEFFRWHILSPLPQAKTGEPMPAAYLPPLLLQCIITGLKDGVTFSLTQTWVGFMTGNLVQFVINAFNLGLSPLLASGVSHATTRTRLELNASALIGFTVGCQLAAHVMQRLTSDRTIRVAIASFALLRCLSTVIIVAVGAKVVAFRLESSLGWLVIAILAAGMGCQSSYSTILATPFSNTVVFTATLTAVASDVKLPTLRLSKSNQLKLLSILGLLAGAALSQVLLKVAAKPDNRDQHLAIQHAFILLLALEFLMGLSWLVCGIRSNWTQYQRQYGPRTPQQPNGGNQD